MLRKCFVGQNLCKIHQIWQKNSNIWLRKARIYHYNWRVGEGLEFPDLWSGQEPWWNWCLTSVVNFGEVRRAQLAKSTLLSSTLCPLDLFRYFQVYSDAKERVGCGKQQEATAPIKSIVKLQLWFLSLRWKTCLRKTAAYVPALAMKDRTLGRKLWWWWWW